MSKVVYGGSPGRHMMMRVTTVMSKVILAKDLEIYVFLSIFTMYIGEVTQTIDSRQSLKLRLRLSNI